MAARHGTLKVKVDGARTDTLAEGLLTPQEWLWALEISKAALVQRFIKQGAAEIVGRKVDAALESD